MSRAHSYRDELLLLGQQMLQNKQFQEALNIFSLLIDTMPTHVAALYYAGVAHLELGEEEQGFERLRQVLELEPAHQQSVVTMLNYLTHKGKYVEAAALWRQYGVQITDTQKQEYYASLLKPYMHLLDEKDAEEANESEESFIEEESASAASFLEPVEESVRGFVYAG